MATMTNPTSSASTSAASSSSSYWKRWLSRIQSRNRNPDLTEESINEFNRRNDARSSPSPYYKGLTDSQLYLNSVRNPARRSSSLHSHSTAATSSSLSTLILKARKLGSSCFRGRSDSNRNAADAKCRFAAPLPPLPPPPNPPRSVSPPYLNHAGSRVSTSPVKGEVEIESDGGNSRVLKEIEPVKGGERRSSDEGKPPTRERIATVSKSGVEEIKWKESIGLKEKFVWGSKHRPQALRDFICNRDKAELLQDLVARGEYSHFIFEGPPGVGKRTMIRAFLREAFGPENLETTYALKEFELKGEAADTLTVNVISSPQHIELSLSELYGYEKHVIMALLEQCDHSNCRAIVLHEADKLTADAQQYIRWVVERYKSCSKFFFCCSDVSKLQPIRSICMLIQLLPPSNHEIIKVLEYIAEQEGIELPCSLAERITKTFKQNLRQAIRSFEASWHMNYPFKEDQVIMTGWEDDIANIAKNIIKEQSPMQLYIIRGMLQILIEHNVSSDFIFETLVEELKKHLDDQLKTRVDALYMEYNESTDKSPALCGRQESGKRHNVHNFMKIEEFTAKFMSFYTKYVKMKVRRGTSSTTSISISVIAEVEKRTP